MCQIRLIHTCVRRGRRGFLERRPRLNLVGGLPFMLEKQPKLLVQDIIERRSNVYHTIQARRQATWLSAFEKHGRSGLASFAYCRLALALPWRENPVMKGQKGLSSTTLPMEAKRLAHYKPFTSQHSRHENPRCSLPPAVKETITEGCTLRRDAQLECASRLSCHQARNTLHATAMRKEQRASPFNHWSHRSTSRMIAPK